MCTLLNDSAANSIQRSVFISFSFRNSSVPSCFYNSIEVEHSSLKSSFDLDHKSSGITFECSILNPEGEYGKAVGLKSIGRIFSVIRMSFLYFYPNVFFVTKHDMFLCEANGSTVRISRSILLRCCSWMNPSPPPTGMHLIAG